MKRRLLAATCLVLVLAACGGSHRVPSGVREIDIRAPGISRSLRKPAPPVSRRVTDLSQVKRIVEWFDSLKPGNTKTVCGGSLVANVTFTFRSTSGADVARANSPPAVAEDCQWIVFTTPGRQETFLIDSNQATPLIDRVERLLSTKFKASGYLG